MRSRSVRQPRATRSITLFLLIGITISIGSTLFAHEAPEKVAVYILAGQSNMEGHGQVRSLPYLADSKDGAALLSRLRGADGKWRTRNDVTVHWPGHDPASGPLGPGWGYGPQEVGPELGFGTVVGDRHEGPVLLIKVAWGGKDVFCDFRSPSAGLPTADEAALLAKERADDREREVGHYYRQMIEQIEQALARIDEIVPGYDGLRSEDGRGYDLAGFAWFQGWNDFCRWHEREPETDRPIGHGIIAAYPDNLAAMIKDLRTALRAPTLPVVIGEMSVGGEPIVERAKNENDREARAMLAFRNAQEQVAEHRGLTGVTFVPTARYWDDRLEELRAMSDRWASEKRKKGTAETDDSPLPTEELSEEFRSRGGHWYCHYNGSAPNYVRIGAALARALEPTVDRGSAPPPSGD